MCVHFPTDTAEPDVDAILQVGTCLAALGEAAFVGLAALGIDRVGVRVEACLDCPIGARLVQIEETVARAGALTTLPVTLRDNPPLDETRTPVVETRAIPTSRRTLLRRFWGGDDAPASPLDGLDSAESAGKSPPRERQALLEVLAQLPDARRAEAPFFPTLTVDSSCTACQLCATICPTDALTFAAEDGIFSLDFAPLACTNCGLCMELCAPQAIHPAEPIAYGESVPRSLISGEVKTCARCHATFAGPGDLCPTCAYRRRHPFGSVPRPAAPGLRVPSSEINS
jgi:ferredoxin